MDEIEALRAEVTELRAEVERLRNQQAGHVCVPAGTRYCPLHPKITGPVTIGDPICTCDPPMRHSGSWTAPQWTIGDPPGGWFPNTAAGCAGGAHVVTVMSGNEPLTFTRDFAGPAAGCAGGVVGQIYTLNAGG